MKYNITIAVMIVFLLAAGWQGVRLWLGDESVSAEDVRQKVEEQYTGSITSMEQKSDRYLVFLTMETGEYELEVSGEDGTIIRMERTQAFQSGEEAPAKTEKNEEPPAPSASPEPSDPQDPMTKEQAEVIALERVPGSVDDVDRESSDNGSFFLVEIEREDDREATVQVNSITGEIMSVSWDD
ncbi:PepSY domain-containing protein [Salibacterium qingdaonense]|uniref:Peptidase propeptide and YPEB domain-containing protein n=1 Tax=Salibacterium qingdaonense TaxID=266892 RepID=A0A1I4NFM8_9BACI|nr:PepSY domain-containing protein [Salibacterium qingdaonense]SFM14269.1 Peptidase propeptide and YPEB domain-containing protein [Salibacterium qingdaonense]